MQRTNMQKKQNIDYKIQGQLLKCLPNLLAVWNLPGFDIELLDMHIFPGSVNGSITTHLHNFVEIHVPISGAGNIIADNKKYKFKPGEFTITGPQQAHHWMATEPPVISHIWWFKITRNDNKPQYDIALLMGAMLSAADYVYNLPDAYWPMYNQLIDELTNVKLGYNQLVTNLVYDILIVLARSLIKRTKIKSVETLSPADEQDRTVGLVDDFLNDNLGVHVSLEDLARQVRLSKRSLTRHYKTLTGKTIGEKLGEMRMFRAEELLRETTLQVKNIAFMCGFRYASHFAKKFENFAGFTPAGYRKKIEDESMQKIAKIKDDKI